MKLMGYFMTSFPVLTSSLFYNNSVTDHSTPCNLYKWEGAIEESKTKRNLQGIAGLFVFFCLMKIVSNS